MPSILTREIGCGGSVNAATKSAITTVADAQVAATDLSRSSSECARTRAALLAQYRKRSECARPSKTYFTREWKKTWSPSV